MESIIIILLFLCIINVYSFQFKKITSRVSNYRRTQIHVFREVEQGNFDNIVTKSNVPVVVDFAAEWCGPCKLMLPIFKALAEEYPEDKVRLVKVDTDLHEETVDKFNIQGVPLFGVFINGEMVASHSGAIGKDRLREFINNALKK